MGFIALARKWRPKTFSDVLGQSATIKILQNSLHADKLHHAYLFTGTRGIGKTTLARIFAKAINCEQGINKEPCAKCSNCISIEQGNHPDVIEIDAASKTKVEDTREVLDNIAYFATCAKFKVYIIDEVHMLSNHSFNALLKTLEEPPEHVKFILATTDPQKLPITILSRCLQFNLHKFSVTELSSHLQKILQLENINFDIEAINRIAIAAFGSSRDALSLLEQVIAFSNNSSISKENVYSTLGIAFEEQLIQLLQHLINNNPQQALSITADFDNKGINFNNTLLQLQTLIHNINIAQVNPDLLTDEIFSKNEIIDISKNISNEMLQRYFKIIINGQKDIPFAVDEKLGFEMVLFRIFALNDFLIKNKSKPSNITSNNNLSSSNTKKTDNLPKTNNIASKNAASPKVVQKPQTLPKEKIENIDHTQANNTKTAYTDENFNQPHTDTASYPHEHQADIDNQYNIKQQQQTPSSNSSVNKWSDIVEHLNLSGLAKILALNSSLKEWSDNNITILLNPSQQPLLNLKNETRLKDALKTLIGKDISLNIEVGISTQETPIEEKYRKAIAAKIALKHQVKQDKVFQELAENFSAVIEDVVTK